MTFILDCCVAISRCLSDEDNSYANGIYTMLLGEQGALVPAFFWLEISNVLCVAERRNRNSREETETAMTLLQSLPLTVDTTPVIKTVTSTLNLARQYNLATYDAAYLELALREKFLLATVDKKLAKVAQNQVIFLENPNID